MCFLPVGGLAGRGAALSRRIIEEPGDVLLELCGVEELRRVSVEVESPGGALLALAVAEQIEGAVAVVVVGLADRVVGLVVAAARPHPRLVVVDPRLWAEKDNQIY